MKRKALTHYVWHALLFGCCMLLLFAADVIGQSTEPVTTGGPSETSRDYDQERIDELKREIHIRKGTIKRLEKDIEINEERIRYSEMTGVKEHTGGLNPKVMSDKRDSPGAIESLRRLVEREKEQLHALKKLQEEDQETLARFEIRKSRLLIEGRWTPFGNDSVVTVRYHEKSNTFKGFLTKIHMKCYNSKNNKMFVVEPPKKDDPNVFHGTDHAFNPSCTKTLLPLQIEIQDDIMSYRSLGSATMWIRVQ